MDATSPRLRFAPSPTGFFHVGSARTVLYNWLIAQRTGGAFVLRIEDTDADRNRPEWVDGILDAMRWLGAEWTEGPFRQSERSPLYQSAIARLLESKLAYHCDCQRADLVARVGEQVAGHGYDGHCRSRDLGPGPGRAVRFATPSTGSTVVVDLIRGEPEFDNATLEDFVVARGDGSATFILANVVDDIDMKITHVVRGEEHLPNTPKAILLWNALAPELALPVFAHVPVLVNEKRQKLSKRRDKVALEDYRLLGVLPEAMRNYLVLLGWSPGGDREHLTLEEMVHEFRLEEVHSSPAFFDLTKLAAFNGEYLRALSIDEYVERFENWMRELVVVRARIDEVAGGLSGSAEERDEAATAAVLGAGRTAAPRLAFDPALYDTERFRSAVPLVRERARLLGEVSAVVEVFFARSLVIDEDSWIKTMLTDGAASAASSVSIAMLRGFVERTPSDAWDAASLKAVVETLGSEQGLKLGKAQAPIRVAVMGRTVGPPLFESLELLGREVTVQRVGDALARLGAASDAAWPPASSTSSSTSPSPSLSSE